MRSYSSIYFLLIFLLTGSGLFTSCMKDKPETFPDTIIWNPELAFPIGTDFFGMNARSGFDTTLFELDSLTGLPLWVDQVEVIMEGSIAFDLSTLDPRIDSVNRVLFRLNIGNEFPNDGLAQAYFLDPSDQLLDSMFSEGPVYLPPGTPIGEGETSEASRIRKDAIFEREDIISLEDASSILFRVTLFNETIDTTLLDYYPSYQIQLEIGMMADMTATF